jgi:hypothetical protein
MSDLSDMYDAAGGLLLGLELSRSSPALMLLISHGKSKILE